MMRQTAENSNVRWDAVVPHLPQRLPLKSLLIRVLLDIARSVMMLQSPHVGLIVSVILDIDLDYFRCSDEPLKRLNELLTWANRPVDSVFTNHHEALAFWTKGVKDGVIDTPHFSLHVDEHHDMLSDTPPINAGNFLYFAMRRWPGCRVHWLVDRRIDSPKQQWLPEEDWKGVTRRFTSGNHLRPGWPTPDLVTVCTSPGFIISKTLRERLLRLCRKWSDGGGSRPDLRERRTTRQDGQKV